MTDYATKMRKKAERLKNMENLNNSYIKALQGVNDKDLNIPIVYMTKEMKSYFNAQFQKEREVINNDLQSRI